MIVVPVYTSLEMFQGTIEGRERARQFKELGCEEIEMNLPDSELNDDCAGLLFSMSAIIHDGAQCKYTVHFISLKIVSTVKSVYIKIPRDRKIR